MSIVFPMISLAVDISAAVSTLALLAFLLFSTLRINNNRKTRGRSRRLTERLLNWK